MTKKVFTIYITTVNLNIINTILANRVVCAYSQNVCRMIVSELNAFDL